MTQRQVLTLGRQVMNQPPGTALQWNCREGRYTAIRSPHGPWRDPAKQKHQRNFLKKKLPKFSEKEQVRVSQDHWGQDMNV